METESTLPLERADQLADQRALIERARRGDPSALRALYDAHVDRVYRLAYRLTGVEHVAQEVTQDTFVRAFGAIEGFRDESTFSTWLHTIAMTTTLNELRRGKRERARNVSLDDAVGVSKSVPESDPILRQKVMEAVNDLPEGCRTVFMMHDAEGFTHRDISLTLGVAEGTSKTQLRRARSLLRVALAGFAEEWKP
jgi:RNA polymerase sigma-70 factor (ECF subfamily)